MPSTLALDLRLIRCPERQVGVWLPVPLSRRLDELARIGHYAWAPTTRKEVLAALLLAENADGRKLTRKLRRYRKARVADAFIPGTEEWAYLYPPDSPGPRRQMELAEILVPREDRPVATPDEPLETARTYRVGTYVPSPLAGRLKLLTRLASQDGPRATSKDLIAALILAAAPEAKKLARQLERYWHGTVADAVIPDLPPEPVISLALDDGDGRDTLSSDQTRTRRAASRKRTAVVQASQPPGAIRTRADKVPPPRD